MDRGYVEPDERVYQSLARLRSLLRGANHAPLSERLPQRFRFDDPSRSAGLAVAMEKAAHDLRQFDV